MPPNPTLQPELTVSYVGHGLQATWTTVPLAAAYRVTVRDAQNTPVYTVDIDASAYTPPVLLTSATFVPQPAATYTVDVVVLGTPSAPQTVTIVELGLPVLTAGNEAGGLRLTWISVPDATAYDLQIRTADGTVVIDRPEITGEAILLGIADGLALDTPYTAVIRARNGRSFGEWTQPLPVQLHSAVQILTALRDRLLANRPAPGAVILDATTLLSDTLLPRTLSAPSLTITTPIDPELLTNPDRLHIAGTAIVLGSETPAQIDATFTASDDLTLQITLICTMPADWFFSETFPELADTSFDFLPLTTPRFIATSYPHRDAAAFYELSAGLNFVATLQVPSTLGFARPPAEAQTLTATIGGPIETGADGPLFRFVAETVLPPIQIAPPGYPALTLSNGVPTLVRTRDGTSLTIDGTAPWNGTSIAFRQQIPTDDAPELTLTAAPTLATVAAAVSAVAGTTALAPYFPPTLLDLADLRVESFSFTYDRTAAAPTTASVTVVPLPTAAWTFVTGRTVRDLTLEIAVTTTTFFPGSTQTTFEALLSGTITLGATDYKVSLAVPTDGPWMLALDDEQQTPVLDVIAGIAGLQAGSITGVFPAFLQPAFGISLANLALWGDPFTATLDRIGFTLAQTEPWQIVPNIAIHDWTVSANIVNGAGGWSPTAILQGSITIGAGDTAPQFDIAMAIPPRPGASFELRLAEDHVVHVPTIAELVALVSSPVTLPVGVATLGGLDITEFLVRFDVSPPTLRRLSFAIAQSSKWTIVDGLEVSNVNAMLGLSRSGETFTATGFIDGVVTIAGTPVAINARLPAGAGDWTLRLADNGVPVPGFSALNTWLAPTSARASLPEGLPLADGFIFAGLTLTFARATGTPTSIAFAIRVNDLWTLIPGKLSITRVSADIRMPYPVEATQVTGSVAGVVTIAGAVFALRASKPAIGTPWTFTGSLTRRLDLDFVAAANAVSTAVLGLPSDISRYGFPASLQILSANVRAVPDTGTFHFDGAANIDWQFDLGIAHLALRALAGQIDIARTGADPHVTIAGAFTLAGIDTTLTLTLGGPTVDTILRGVVTPANASQVSIATLANALAAPTPTDNFATIAPPRLATPALTAAALYVNMTKGQFALYGTLAGLGSATLLVTKRPANDAPANDTQAPATWQYFFAIALASDFRFATLLPDLAPIDGVLAVRDAGFSLYTVAGQTLTALNDTLTGIVTGDPTYRWPLSSEALPTIELQRGVLFFGTLQFPPTSVFGNLLRIGSDAAPPRVIVSALIDRAEATRSIFVADLPDITILNTIKLTHTAAYPGIHLQYTALEARRLDLTGRLELQGIFGKTYAFDGRLTVTDDTLKARLDLGPAGPERPDTTVSPFGLPGIVIDTLYAEANTIFAKPAAVPAVTQSSRFAIGGHVAFGTPPTLSFQTRLELVDGKPALALIQVDADLSIGTFLAQCVTGSGATWPSNFIDLVIRAARDGRPASRIYYYDPAADPTGALHTDAAAYVFQPGFNVDAEIELTLLTTIALRLTITTLRDAASGRYIGIRGSAALLAPIDLGFMQFAGTTQSAGRYTGGPLLAIETGPTTLFGFSTGLNFLDKGFLAVTVAVGKDSDGNTALAGRLETADSLEPFGALRCDFIYTVVKGGANRFRIANWPDFTWARELVNFVEGIKNAVPAGSTCGELVDLIATQLLRTTYNIAPSVSMDDTSLIFRVSGSYVMSVRGATQPFLTVDFPPIDIHIPKTTRYNDLPQALATGIGNASVTFARDLMSRPDKIALYLAMAYGPKAVGLAMELACDGLVDGAAAAAVEAAVTAIAAAGGAIAVGAATGIIAIIGRALADGGGSHGGGDHPGGGGDHPPSDPGPPTTPSVRSVGYANSKLTVAWGAANYASGYTLQAVAPNGTTVLARETYGYVLTGTLTLDAATLAAGTYIVRLAATRGAQTSPWTTQNLVKPAAPTPTLSYANGTLSTTFSGQTGTTYHIAFHDPAGNLMGSEIPVTATPYTARVALPAPVAGAYAVKLRADVAAGLPGDAGAPVTLDILTLTAPTATDATYTAGVLTVTWTDATAPAGVTYEVDLLQNGQSAATARATTTTTPIGPVTPGTAYTVTVRATVPDHLSPWSQPAAITPIDVPAPPNASLTWNDGTLLAHWTPIAPTGGDPPRYSVRLFASAAPTVAVGTVSDAPTPGVSMTANAPFATGESFVITVAATAGKSSSAFGPASPAFPIVIPPLPTEITLTETGVSIAATWQPIQLPAAFAGQPITYDTELAAQSDPGTVLVASKRLSTPEANLTPTGSAALKPEQAYIMRVRAVIGPYGGAWATSEPLLTLATPIVTSSEYDAPEVVMRWQPANRADSYEIELRDQAGNPLVQTRSATVTTPPLEARFAGPFTDNQVVTAIVRARQGRNAGSWSEPGAAETAPDRLRIAIIPPPANLTLIARDKTIEATWTLDPLVSGGHSVTVMAADGTPLPTQPNITYPTPTTILIAVIDATTLTEGATYGVAVRARASRSTSLPSIANVLLGPTRIARLVTLTNTFGVSLTATVRDPAGQPPLTVARGQTTPLGTIPVTVFDMVTLAGQAELVGAVVRHTVTVTAAGPRIVLATGLVTAGQVPEGLTVQTTKGLRLGAEDRWADTTRPPVMAAWLAPVFNDPGLLVTVLRMTYPDLNLAALTDALAAAGYTAAVTAIALRTVIPAPTAPQLAAAIKQVFVDPTGFPGGFASQRAAWGWSAQRTAPDLAAAFPTAATADLGNTLMMAFPRTGSTALLLAWALAAANRPATEAAAIIRIVLPMTTAPALAAALHAAYPDPDVLARIIALTAANTPPLQTATQLHTEWPALTPIDIAALLVAHQPAARAPAVLTEALAAIEAPPAEIVQAVVAALLPPPP